MSQNIKNIEFVQIRLKMVIQRLPANNSTQSTIDLNSKLVYNSNFSSLWSFLLSCLAKHSTHSDIVLTVVQHHHHFAYLKLSKKLHIRTMSIQDI